MKNILLILSTSRTSQNAIRHAVSLAKKEKAKLVVLYIIETELTNEIFDKFTDIGFIGDKPSTRVILLKRRLRLLKDTRLIQQSQ